MMDVNRGEMGPNDMTKSSTPKPLSAPTGLSSCQRKNTVWPSGTVRPGIGTAENICRLVGSLPLSAPNPAPTDVFGLVKLRFVTWVQLVKMPGPGLVCAEGLTRYQKV